MTDNQIKMYEKELNNWKASSFKNPYEKLSAKERIKEEDRILKGILDNTQYKNYRKWANDNDHCGI